MGILIDANVFIDAERGEMDIDAAVEGLGAEEDCLVSAITASELLHGVHRAKEARVRSRRAAFVEQILDRFPVLPIDLQTARTHARLWADLQSKGKMTGPHDLWLAAACIAGGHTLATANLGEFSQVPGLRLKAWRGRS